MFQQDKIIEDWNSNSDQYYSNTEFEQLFDRLKKDPYAGFPAAISRLIQEYYPDLKGKRVCVPSCGDCTAVFSFCTLGARVTATDISYKQIENAKKVAEKHKLELEFFVSDSMKLEEVQDNTYDLVYTSNGVHVWINDLNQMYQNIYRILKKEGRYLMFDTHPSVRPFDRDAYKGQFHVQKRYEDIGPFGEVPTFDWRTMDYVNALATAGFSIQRMEEFHSIVEDLPSCNYLYEKDDPNHENFDWHKNPWAALPQCLGLCSKKM